MCVILCVFFGWLIFLLIMRIWISNIKNDVSSCIVHKTENICGSFILNTYIYHRVELSRGYFEWFTRSVMNAAVRDRIAKRIWSHRMIRYFSVVRRDAVDREWLSPSFPLSLLYRGTDKYRLCENSVGGSRSRFRGSISKGLMALLTAVLFNVDLCIGVGRLKRHRG